MREGSWITTLGLAGAFGRPEQFDVFPSLARRDDVPLRVVAYLRHQQALRAGGGPTVTSDRFRIAGVKLWYDGSPYTGSMLLDEPYLETDLCCCTLGIEPGTTGWANFDPHELTDLLAELHARGWQVLTHAQGDRACREIIDLYDAGIRQFDEQLQPLLDVLAESTKDTLVVLTSDHGEEFLEHGGWQHGFTLYQETVHVPLVFFAPNAGIAPRRVAANASLIDILPTLRELLDLHACVERGVVFADMDAFYRLARTVLVKDERHYDRFDRAFGAWFEGLEDLDAAIEALIPDDVVRIGRRGEHWIGGVESEHVHDDSVLHQGLHDGSSFIEHLRFKEAVLGHTAPEVSLYDGLLSVAIGAAAHRSIDEGRPVEVAEFLR